MFIFYFFIKKKHAQIMFFLVKTRFNNVKFNKHKQKISPFKSCNKQA